MKAYQKCIKPHYKRPILMFFKKAKLSRADVSLSRADVSLSRADVFIHKIPLKCWKITVLGSLNIC